MSEVKSIDVAVLAKSVSRARFSATVADPLGEVA